MLQNNRVLFVLTSHYELGKTGQLAGWYLPEVAHPYSILSPHFEVVFAAPLGGNPPMDPQSFKNYKDDPQCDAFLKSAKAQHDVKNALKLSDVNPNDYDALILPGGHAPMFDLAQDENLDQLVSSIYEKGGVVAGICHGPVGLINARLSTGDYLVNGKRMTSFSNEEEEDMGLTKEMPFLLEDRIKERGAVYEKADKPYGEKVVVDGRLITGQNPASAPKFGQAILDVLQESRRKEE